MTSTEPDSLHAYYEQSGTSPTFAQLADRAKLDDYAAMRAMVLEDRLSLPLRVFQGADLLEFGPDTGENALVFALWGSRVTLVEPNPQSIGQIRDYFSRFGLEDRLARLETCNLQAFRSEQAFDVIVAEGFIYTLDSVEAWQKQFHALLRPGGLAVLSYYERYAAFLELTLRAALTSLKDIAGGSGLEAAERLFRPKWDSIPHSRRFESWVMDVLENPFVRLDRFFDAATLCRQARDEGFALYSSWPVYKDALTVYWHKRSRSEAELLEETVRNIERSRLSHLYGSKCFLTDDSDCTPERLGQILEELLLAVDRQIDGADAESAQLCAQRLGDLGAILRAPGVQTETAESKQQLLALTESLKQLFSLMAAGDGEGLVAHCRTDRLFIEAWGVPCNLAVFQRSRQP